MKTLNALFVTLSLLSPTLTWACMPPPPNTPIYLVQQRYLQKVLSDENVAAEIERHGLKTRILSFQLDQGTLISLSNGCTFRVETDFTNASPGTCPDFLPLKVTESLCNFLP